MEQTALFCTVSWGSVRHPGNIKKHRRPQADPASKIASGTSAIEELG